MSNHLRAEYVTIADDTLQILENKQYHNKKGELVSIVETLDKAVRDSVLYTPSISAKIEFDARRLVENRKPEQTIIEVTKETSLQAVKRLVDDGGNVLCLNFASARTPGGGFRKGASAQEETIARSSGLFPCISQMRDMYDHNRQVLTGFYSDHMIYSPQVPVFKDDKGELLDKPHCASFITAPAVNSGVVRDKAWSDSHLIMEVMKRRIELILSLCIIHEHDVLILGAFGCGVFRNEPQDVAELFRTILIEDERFKASFRKIVFAVYDPSPNEVNFKPFQQAFLKNE